MGANMVINPFPLPQLSIEFIPITQRNMKGIEFIEMSMVNPFEPAIQSRRAERQDKQANARVGAGLLKLRPTVEIEV